MLLLRVSSITGKFNRGICQVRGRTAREFLKFYSDQYKELKVKRCL